MAALCIKNARKKKEKPENKVWTNFLEWSWFLFKQCRESPSFTMGVGSKLIYGGDMKLYYSKGACSLAVRIIIHEIGILCEFESVDLKTKRTETGVDFLKINPKGAVPVLLVEGKNILTENAVIQQYLADQHKAYELLPSVNAWDRYHVLEWLNFMSSDLHKGFGPLFNPHVPAEIKETIFKKALKSKLEFVNDCLQKTTYLTGEHFTLPDSYLFVMLRWLVHFDMALNEYAHLARYFSVLKNRKSVAKALAEEGL